MPYWINSTLAATPALLWMFVGVGLPWSLLLLPRADWRDRPLVAALALVAGPALLTAWMFFLGSFTQSTLLRPLYILAGSGLIALVGWALLWRKRQTSASESGEKSRSAFSVSALKVLPWRSWRLGGSNVFSFLGAIPFRTTRWLRTLPVEEWLLIVLIIVALAVRWLNVAYWPHMAYDEMWVYGYEGRLYTLVGNIPQTIGYYPQFLPLQFSYLQIVTVGGLDDHVARAVLPYLQLGGILAVYALGTRLFNRRAGLFAAALWTFYPHVGEWSRFGDLELPLTFVFTLAATFFLMAWLHVENRRRYALLAGLTFGVAMWTKPTAGAFAWGVMLLTAFELLRLRFNWRAWWPRFEVALITGLACIPLGGMWYLRNILLGHPPLVFPEPFWLTQAARSGLEFSFPLLALVTLLLFILSQAQPRRFRPIIEYLLRVLPGIGLVLLALLPSMLGKYRMGALEFALLAAGCGWLFWVLRPYVTSVGAQRAASPDIPPLSAGGDRVGERGFATDLSRLGWAYLLALPYFVTWFYSYSYHYRLSFAIVPLMLLPTAVLLARWLSTAQVRGVIRRTAFAAAVILGAYWGIIVPLYDMNAGWMWDYDLPDDFARYTSGNWALMRIVYALQEYKDVFGVPLRISAPGVQRLGFFFPLDYIDNEHAPTHLEDLSDMTHYVYSFEGERMYHDVDPLDNEVAGARALHNVMLSSSTLLDGDFLYELYAVYLPGRFQLPAPLTPACVPAEEVLIAGVVRFYGCNVPDATLHPNTPFQLTLYWYAAAQPTEDYYVTLQLLDAEGNVRAESSAPPVRADDRYYYSTLFWDSTEYVQDPQTLNIDADVPVGEGYRLLIGMVRASDGTRLPLTVNGQAAGDSYTLDIPFSVAP